MPDPIEMRHLAPEGAVREELDGHTRERLSLPDDQLVIP
jgi:hypothetical protein